MTVARLVTSDGVIADEEPGVPERRLAGAHVHAAVPAPLQSGVRSHAALLPCQICLMDTVHPHASTCSVPPAMTVQHQGAGRITAEKGWWLARLPCLLSGTAIRSQCQGACPICRERLDAGEAAGQWATIGVLTEKSKPRQGSSGQAFSMWKVSDLAGTQDPRI